MCIFYAVNFNDFINNRNSFCCHLNEETNEKKKNKVK